MRILHIVLFFILSVVVLQAANISVDEMSIVADIHFDAYDNKMKNNTYLNFQTSFQGGYKFSAKTGFQLNTAELESLYLSNSLSFGGLYLIFDNASVTARDLFNSLLDLSIWTGTYKYLGSGNIYRGYMFYPSSDQPDIQGFYRLRGTGVSANIKFWEERFRIKLHLYNNTNFIQPEDSFTKLNFFSFDNEIGLYLDFLYLELFYGYTKDFIYPNRNAELEFGRAKAGVTFWVGNKDIEFFTTIGLPDLDAEAFAQLEAGTRNMFDSLYLIAELKFNLYITENTISFLTTPALYNEQGTYDKTDFNVNYKLLISSPDKLMNGGAVINFNYEINSDATQSWGLVLAPYFSFVLSGVEWYISTGYNFANIVKAQETGNNFYSLEGLNIILGVTSNF